MSETSGARKKDQQALERSALLQREADEAPAEPMTRMNRGEQLEAVLELAEVFPVRHSPSLDAPVFGR